MTDLSEFERRTQKQTAPRGWEPSIQWDERKGGEITAGPFESEPDEALWGELIKDWGFDPNKLEIVQGSIQVRAWDSAVGGGEIRKLRYYRATLQSRTDTNDREDIEVLLKDVLKRKPSKKVLTGEECSFLILASDWQAGKGEGGGTVALIERVMQATDEICIRLNNLKRIGMKIGAVYIVGLGDLVEQCSGHYAMQAFQTDLDRREQMRVVRRLLLRLVNRLVDEGYTVVLGAVPGNHGENRNSSGKAFTTWTDNDDLAVFDQLGEILSANPERYKNVNIPLGAIADDLTLTLDISGVPVSFAHGHQFSKGGNAQKRMEDWLSGQALGRQSVASAEILFAGHLHHFVISEATGRTVIQVPAMDGGSKWYTSKTGANSPAGMLTVCISKNFTRGWSELAIL